MPRRPPTDVDAYVAELAAKGISVTVGPPPRLDVGHAAPVPKGPVSPLAARNALLVPPRNGLVVIEVVMAIRVKSEANLREHWAYRKRRVNAQQSALTAVLNGLVVPEPPVTVTWTKLGGRGFDDDNLAISFKHLRDGLAEYYGLDDRSGTGLDWRYEQRPGGPAGVCLRIERVPAAP